MRTHYPLQRYTQPQEPACADEPCCVWCGLPLPDNCPSDDFGSDSCESMWRAWRNGKPIDYRPELAVHPIPPGSHACEPAWTIGDTIARWMRTWGVTNQARDPEPGKEVS